ncbi:MAG TPA: hypothetical protein VIV11_26170, partial [Kofleriaceae bacterium]
MTDDDKKSKSRDSQASIPVEIERRNVGKMNRPAEYPRQASPPVEEATDVQETIPIVMTPELPPSAAALPADDSLPVRPEIGTLPFELLPPRGVATPASGIPKVGEEEPVTTQPLDLPRRAPASHPVVMVEMTEQNTGVLAVTEDSRTPAPRPSVTREISAAVDALLDDRPPERSITVELVEEKSGVLSAADTGDPAIDKLAREQADPPAKPLSAAAAKLAAEKARAVDKAQAAADKVEARDKAASDKAAAKQAARKAATLGTGPDKAGPDKAGSDKAAADRAGFDRAGFDRASFDRASSDRASSDRAGSDKATSDKATSDKAGSDKAG